MKLFGPGSERKIAGPAKTYTGKSPVRDEGETGGSNRALAPVQTAYTVALQHISKHDRRTLAAAASLLSRFNALDGSDDKGYLEARLRNCARGVVDRWATVPKIPMGCWQASPSVAEFEIFFLNCGSMVDWRARLDDTCCRK
jgi:hypothetical protein